MTRTKSSRRWLTEHFTDPYVKQAQAEGYRSRAVFKLLEIQAKDKLIKPGMTVVDLGAAPGGWSQVAVKQVGAKGRVVALDILPMDPIVGVEFIQGDFREQVVLDELLKITGDSSVDLVFSDIAPNMSGNKNVDLSRVYYIADLALDFVDKVLREGGAFLIKVFQGAGFEALLKKMRNEFKQVVIRKPQASRARSNETYLLGKGYTKKSGSSRCVVE